MEITTHKEVTHTIEMSQSQLTFLVRVLEDYKREIIDRMPDGYSTSSDFGNMLCELRSARESGDR